MDSQRSAAGTAARTGGSTPEPAHDSERVAYVGYYQDRRGRVERFPGGEALDITASRNHATHSREFEWGYNGSGPAQLALALLLDYYDDPEIALECYQQFCRRVVSDLDTDASGTWRLTSPEIERAVAEIQEATTDG